MKRLLALALLTGLLLGSAAAQEGTGGFEGDIETLHVGENATLNATIVNPLPVSDTLMVIFGGPAITNGLVTPHYQDRGDISCDNLQSRCTVQMGPDSEKDIRIKLEGTAIGQGTLKGTVNSTITQLSSTDRIEVRVKPYFAPVTVSAPGIQELQMFVLAILGALTAGFLTRR